MQIKKANQKTQQQKETMTLTKTEKVVPMGDMKDGTAKPTETKEDPASLKRVFGVRRLILML